MRRCAARGPKAAGRWLLLLVGMFLLALLALGLWMNQRLKPMVAAKATASLTNMVTDEVGLALAEIDGSLRSYEKLAHFHYDGNGNLVAVSTDLDTAAKLQAQITEKMTAALSRLKEKTISIPAGSLTGVGFLSGKGFSVPVTVESILSVSSEITSELTEIGINQMLHRMEIVITTDITILCPGGSCTASVESRVPLTESLLLGSVPESYTYFVPESGS